MSLAEEDGWQSLSEDEAQKDKVRRRKKSQITVTPRNRPTTPNNTSSSNVYRKRVAQSRSPTQQFGKSPPPVLKQDPVDARPKSKPAVVDESYAHFTQALRNVALLALRLVTTLLSISLNAFTSFFSLFLSHLFAFLFLFVLLGGLVWYISTLLPSFQLSSLFFPTSVLSPAAYAYCSIIGIGCRNTNKKSVARLARAAADQANQAHDIFQSLVAIGDSKALGLHFVEIWELAVAVQSSSELPMKDEFGSALVDLGDKTRDIKDLVVKINSAGINTFSWTVHEFKVIERTIKRMHEQSGKYSEKDIAAQLDLMIENLSSSLDEVLKLIGKAIPIADDASSLGGEVLKRFAQEEKRLTKLKEDTPLWRLLLEKNTYKGRQLSRDIDLTSLSIEEVKSARWNLEKAREFLLQYRANLGYFKSSMIGFHLADNHLEPEHEVEALSDIMTQFSSAVDKARRLPSKAEE